jgi:uroporphyrinogen III methyltransferase/synthase
LKDRWVLIPVADIAHDTLPKAIEAAGGVPHIITVYHTIPAEPDTEGLVVLKAGVDLITFTSGSTVQNFFTLAQAAGLDPLNLPGNPKIACIGPKTEKTARDLGFNVHRVAEPHTTDGLVATIQKEMSLQNQ